MHPSKSIIFFTVISGTGYGVFFGLLYNILFIEISYSLEYKLISSLASFIMIVSGLLSSTFHLGHPERAWRAISQWKTSWLSREGLAAIVTFVPMFLFYISWLLESDLYFLFLILTCMFSIITIFCTGQMYATLKTIPSWNNPLVTPIYILNGIMVGSLFVYSINFYFNYNIKSFEHFIFVVIIVNFISKIIYWISINKNKSKTSTQTAIGLKGKEISFFEGPHTGKNYLTTEMINRIKKSNANFLRLVFCILSFITPIYAIYSYKTLIVDPLILNLSMIIVFFLALVGMIIERYLFFIQSKHVVGLYYGQRN